jgi:hypothetical protein
MRPKQKGTAAPKTGAAVPLLLFCFILLLSGSAAGYPLIGCGLAGGNDDRIIGMLETELADTENVTLVLFQPQN